MEQLKGGQNIFMTLFFLQNIVLDVLAVHVLVLSYGPRLDHGLWRMKHVPEVLLISFCTTLYQYRLYLIVYIWGVSQSTLFSRGSMT